MRRVLTDYLYTRKMVTVALMMIAQIGFAQNVTIQSGFLSDSIKIGEETGFYVAVRYPASNQVLFPDSTHAFSPFEFVRRKYAATKTTDGVSMDSAVYILTTFEIDRVQRLQLPIYELVAGDCTRWQTLPDSLLITQLVAEVPDSVSTEKLPLRRNTTYEKVRQQFNVIVASIVAGIIILVLIIVWIVFGKKIRNWFVARRLTRRHQEFIRTFDERIQKHQELKSAGSIETAVLVWKKYLEQMMDVPFTKMTTRETLYHFPEHHLEEPMKTIDRGIYGYPEDVSQQLRLLRQSAEGEFTKRLKEVQHGR